MRSARDSQTITSARSACSTSRDTIGSLTNRSFGGPSDTARTGTDTYRSSMSTGRVYTALAALSAGKMTTCSYSSLVNCC